MDTPKIIFLDIDGVLNVIGQGHDKFGQIFHKEFEDNLRWIIDQTGAKIVISSSWRGSGLSEMQRMWKFRNLPGEVIDITPFADDVVARGTCEFYDEVTRGMEIDQWVVDNNIDNYCIIDDDCDMMTHQMDKFVRTSNNKDHPECIDIGYGLTRKCSELAIEILKTNRN